MNQGAVVLVIACMWLTGRPFYLGILATAEEEGAKGGDDPLHHHHKGLKAWQAVANDFFAMLQADAWACTICLVLIAFVDSNLIVGAANGPTSAAGAAAGTRAYIGIVPVLFDLASGYGNVGLSMGYPGVVTSSSGALSTFSKLVVVFFMMHGYCMGIFPASIVNLELPPGVDVGAAAAAAPGAAEDEAALLLHVMQRLQLRALDVRALALVNVTAAEAALAATGDSAAAALAGDTLDLLVYLERELEGHRLSPFAAATLVKKVSAALWEKARADDAQRGALARSEHPQSQRFVGRGGSTPGKREMARGAS